MGHGSSSGTVLARCALALLGAAVASAAVAQTGPKRGPVIPSRELPVIPMPGRMAPSPFISRTNPAVTPFVSMPSAQQPRGTLPAPPRSALEAALSRPFVMDVATARLLADARAFTARAEMDMVMGPPNARTTNTVPLVVAFLEGRMRMDMDVNEVRSSTIPAPMFTALIELDLNKVVSVVRPDRRVLHVMYPDLRGYIDFPLTPEEVAGTMKVERTQAGRGTALGESCAMQRVVVTCESTNRHEATVWLSDAQRGFPVQIQWTEPNAQVTFRYLQVNFIQPELPVFEPPSTYSKFTDAGLLMQTASQRKSALARMRRSP